MTMEFGREPQTPEEERLVESCYKKGMENGWASGRFAHMDGNFIAKADRLNKNSICFIDNAEKLRGFFERGNWCLGAGVIYSNLFFLQQVNGGDEWATYRIANDTIYQFESITFQPMIERGHDYKGRSFEEYITDLVNGGG